MVLLLNQANKIIHEEILSEGGITGTVADPRIIFKLALSHQATGFIICHNHPSGQVEPSQADIDLTRSLRTSLSLVDVRVHDHIIVSRTAFFSFVQAGLL